MRGISVEEYMRSRSAQIFLHGEGGEDDFDDEFSENDH